MNLSEVIDEINLMEKSVFWIEIMDRVNVQVPSTTEYDIFRVKDIFIGSGCGLSQRRN